MSVLNGFPEVKKKIYDSLSQIESAEQQVAFLEEICNLCTKKRALIIHAANGQFVEVVADE